MAEDTTNLIASGDSEDDEMGPSPPPVYRTTHRDSEVSILPSQSTRKRRKFNLLPRIPTVIVTTKKGSMNIISSKFESLDYDLVENHLTQTETWKSYNFIIYKNLTRWVIFFLIGVFTACIGAGIDIAIEFLASFKFSMLKSALDGGVTPGGDGMLAPLTTWLAWNVLPVLLGSLLVTYVEPVALGSGIPQIKCYLNGIKMPRLVRIRTLLVKTVGVITTVVGGLAGGKEGPMIHSGAVVAAGISQGKSTSLGKDFHILKYFREDHEKRDFVSGGAAAGVAAAFGAPVGGVLFSLEEGASFWNQSLTWRIFFACMMSTFTLNVILSAYYGHWGQLTDPGLLNFGKFYSLQYSLLEIVLFVGMGVFGGLTGALYNSLNHKLTVFRLRYMSAKWVKVAEACLVAIVSAVVPIVMIYTLNDCRPLGEDPTENPVQMFCGDGEYNTLAGLWLQVPEKSVRTLFHDPKGAINPLSLACFVVAYFLLAVWTYGISVSGGVFIPCLLTGAAWGRLFSQLLGHLFPGQDWVEPGKYALIGAAAQLGGVVRMTISLTVILIEATGNISFGLPLMLTLITAKWIGDFFTEGLYDIHIQLAGIPLLAWDPPPLSSNITARIVKSHPVICLRPVETVGNIMDVLKATTHNGFPIVEVVEEEEKGGKEGGKGGLSRRHSRRTPRSVSAATTPTTPTGHLSPTRTSFPTRPASSHHQHLSSPSSDDDNTESPTREKHSAPGQQGDTESRVDCKESPGRLVGLILRSQLITLIKNKIYKENQNWSDEMITSDIFHNEYPRYPDVTDLTVPAEERHLTVKLNMFMNVSPFSVQDCTSLPRVFKLFRALGLRHVVVVNKENHVVGMITRKDLARYRVWKHAGRMGLEELWISSNL
uniref:Chloride channel protein n=1 Tax=Cacopsylla melanoneura TaxID=428564 RepID=A0A8D9AXJ9_9HEMI